MNFHQILVVLSGIVCVALSFYWFHRDRKEIKGYRIERESELIEREKKILQRMLMITLGMVVIMLILQYINRKEDGIPAVLSIMITVIILAFESFGFGLVRRDAKVWNNKDPDPMESD